MPFEAAKISENNGTLSDCYSFAKSDKENVVVETIKKAEEDNSVIVRAYETYNMKADAEITVGFDIKEAYLCDLMENVTEKAEYSGRSVKVRFKNYEIVTLKLIPA